MKFSGKDFLSVDCAREGRGREGVGLFAWGGKKEQ